MQSGERIAAMKLGYQLINLKKINLTKYYSLISEIKISEGEDWYNEYLKWHEKEK